MSGISICFKFLHPAKPPILLKLFGNTTSSKLVPLKAEYPMFSSPSGKFICCMFVQPEKLYLPIFLTPAGIVIPSNSLHPLKASAPISVIFSGISTYFRFSQLRNA